MAVQRLAKVWAWALGMLLLISLPAAAQRISDSLNQDCSRQDLLAQLAQAKVVYLGETHDRPEDHQAQLDIVRSLYRRNPKIAIALEMFQRPYQIALDRYLAGELTEAELQAQSQYPQRWGFPWAYYAPLLQFAKQHRLPLLALNTPTEVTRQVSRSGLSSLTPQALRWIPPLNTIDTTNAAYRKLIWQSYRQFHQGSARNFEPFFQAQVVWDETMAATIAEFLQANPGHQVIVLAGQGHIIYDYGIPSRVARRMATQKRRLVQTTVLLNPQDTEPFSGQAAADYFWYSPANSPPDPAPTNSD